MKLSKDQTKDELINLIKKKHDEMKGQNTVLKQQNDEFRKGNAGSEQQIKAITEMHSQKVRTLLKSINNLKKEVAKTKFEQKDNVRIQKNQRLEKDIELLEITVNALRKLVNEEDRCDAAVKAEFEKGPKRVRIAAREELKIEINKYKNISLRLMDEMKRNSLKIPNYATRSSVNKPETGLREEAEQKAATAQDHLEAQSEAGSAALEMGADGGLNDSGAATAEQLINEKHRLEDVIVKLNIDMKNKNEKILELVENIEDLKIQVYSRDKALELQQAQIEQAMEDLREAKQFEHQCKTLKIINNSLEEENARLQVELDQKIERDVKAELEQDDGQEEKETLTAHVQDLQTQLDAKKKDERANNSKVKQIENKYKDELENVKSEARQSKNQARDLSKERDDVQSALTRANKAVQQTLAQKVQMEDEVRKTQGENLAMQQKTSAGTNLMAQRVKDLEAQVKKKDGLLTTQAQSLRRASQQSQQIQKQLQSQGQTTPASQNKPPANQMNNKWQQPKAASATVNQDEIVARRRAALAEMDREEQKEADQALDVANKLHIRADRSLSKGKGDASARADMGIKGGTTLNQKTNQSQQPSQAEDVQARKRAEARAAIRAEESDQNRRQEETLSKAHDTAEKTRGRSKLIPPSASSAAVAAAASAQDFDDCDEYRDDLE